MSTQTVEDKLQQLRLEYLTHAAVAVQNETEAKILGRRFLGLCHNRNTRPVEYFCCLNCGLPRSADKGTTACRGCQPKPTA